MTDSGEDQLRCAQIYAAHEHPKVAQPVWRGERYDNSRIRVAYMSADFRDHPVSYLIPRLLELHDRNRFEVYGFSLMEETTSAFGARVKRAFEHFEVVKNVGDVELARMLRDLRIDIAIDLMGPTNFNRKEVLSMRPCPIQVSYLGYPGTSGTEFLDYIIADAYVVPSGFERFYSEKIVRLPDTFQCTDAERRAADPAVTRSEVGLPDAAIVYCCFNNSAKFSPAIFDLWMQILRQVPRGVLWLFAGHPTLQQNLAKEATARGIDAKRLFFAPRVEYPLHLRRMMLADVFLDTLPFNAGTNASDALWAGVPVVTRSGEAFASRMAGSLLHAIGMPGLITNTPEEYVALAVRLGNDPALLAATKAKLAANRLTQPLFDTDRFRRHLEAAYVAMWERTQRGEPPDHLTIAPMG
jgi:predicted O-linked N-acetylglucosamine transferase (SPINDLY family)